MGLSKSKSGKPMVIVKIVINHYAFANQAGHLPIVELLLGRGIEIDAK